jgi:phospholipid N-methyltransferase
MTIEERINELGEKYEKQKEINKELVDENHKLADCNARLLDQVGAATKQAIELEKKNAELKERLAEVNLNGNIVLRELTKAKEILKEAQGYIENNDDALYDEIEQFIQEEK